MTHRTFRTMLLGLVIAIVLAACSSGPGSSPADPQEPSQPTQPTDPADLPLTWADVLTEYRVEEAIYAVGLHVPGYGLFAIGTGFAAHYVDAIWTNAHVLVALVNLINQYPHLGLTAVAVQSGSTVGETETYELIYYHLHPEWDGTVASPDLALITTDREMPAVLDLLPREHVTKLQTGQPIGTMGFPGELAEAYRVAPIATFKEGSISALRPFSEIPPTPANTTLVQHNLSVSGGTSGSPIIDFQGYVIAVNHAAFEALVWDENSSMLTRIGVGTIEFGIRADEVWAIVDLIDSSAERVAASKRPILDSYQAFPENWDGTTIAPTSE